MAFQWHRQGDPPALSDRELSHEQHMAVGDPSLGALPGILHDPVRRQARQEFLVGAEAHEGRGAARVRAGCHLSLSVQNDARPLFGQRQPLQQLGQLTERNVEGQERPRPLPPIQERNGQAEESVADLRVRAVHGHPHRRRSGTRRRTFRRHSTLPSSHGPPPHHLDEQPLGRTGEACPLDGLVVLLAGKTHEILPDLLLDVGGFLPQSILHVAEHILDERRVRDLAEPGGFADDEPLDSLLHERPARLEARPQFVGDLPFGDEMPLRQNGDERNKGKRKEKQEQFGGEGQVAVAAERAGELHGTRVSEREGESADSMSSESPTRSRRRMVSG